MPAPRQCPTCGSPDPTIVPLIDQPADTVACTDPWHNNPEVVIDHGVRSHAAAREAKWVADGGPEFVDERQVRKAAAIERNGWDPDDAANLDISDPATWAWDSPLHELLFYAAMGDLTPLADALHEARTPEPTEAGPEPERPVASHQGDRLRDGLREIIDRYSVDAAALRDRTAAGILHDAIHLLDETYGIDSRPEPTPEPLPSWCDPDAYYEAVVLDDRVWVQVNLAKCDRGANGWVARFEETPVVRVGLSGAVRTSPGHTFEEDIAEKATNLLRSALASTFEGEATLIHRFPPLADTVVLETILATIFLHGRWEDLTRHMSVAERERFADAVEAWSARLNLDTLDAEPMRLDRYWR